MGHDLSHAQHSEVTPALLWIELETSKKGQCLKVMIALERPFYKHFPELQGTNSDWLFSQFGNRSRKSRKYLSKRNTRTDS